MTILRSSVVLVIAVMVFSVGCSSNKNNPVAPENTIDNFSLTQQTNSDSNHVLLGTWTVTFDVENLTAVVNPVRETQAHYNVRGLIPLPSVSINSYDPVNEVLDVDVTISNTYPVDAFDLRLIIYTDDIGHLLLNHDNWIDLYDLPGGQDINPFVAYAKDDTFRTFRAETDYTENLQIHTPGGNFVVNFAIDASYPYNCREPYKIENFIQADEIFDVAGWLGWIQIDIVDWQSSVSKVTIAAPEITGEPETDLNYVENFTWGVDLVNNVPAPAGEYSFLVTGISEDPFELSLYEYVTVTILESREVVDWTFLVYMHESNLGAYAIQNLNAMEVIGSLPFRTDFVVLWDKENDPNDVILHIEKDPDGNNPTLISPEIDDNGEVIPPGGLNMGSGDTLEKFLRWSMNNYPAEHYALILWDHGNGPFSFVPDQLVKSCCNGLQIWEIRDACQAVLDEHPETDKLDMIGFDCCLMGWIETAYCLRDVTKSTVASEMLEPAPGWKYSQPLEYLNNNHDTCTYEDLSSEFVYWYLLYGISFDKTLSAVRSSDLVDNVIPALNDLASELMDALSSGKRNLIRGCRDDCGSWGAYCGDGWVKDLGYLAELIGSSSLPETCQDAAWTLHDALDNAMISHGHSGDGSSACPFEETGLQIWFPAAYNSDNNDGKREDYVKLDFNDTLWDEFLNQYD